ncbi:M20/M25/M40 family metallo-hydrolase [Neobacillus sp. MM2021_6]|uniref:M20/M25/M40 family metallo-hydrolase n=1 Tax=Bacillaceae TaxID=186817 RepID=UPI00140CB7A2|nr:MULTISPECIES: M20/M25/M40 family metallo-hydrolase [Bacillaceae]MBO0960062.1 M20/M25/M40 family metallo-hydrolase [Neobacillus sp. MM2021_6]NHC21277.1 M20/M25/M40 family metallo-hydrolase [Bacillus sp. MM2020_4]
MKSWNQLFIRHGFIVTEVRPNIFDCRNETEVNLAFLQESLEELSISFTLSQGVLSLTSPVVEEDRWVEIVDNNHRGRGEDLWFRPGQDQPKVKELDTYIAGMVRQLNRLGFFTEGSCDGHNRRNPTIGFIRQVNVEAVMELLLAVGIPHIFKRNRFLNLRIQRNLLLDITENLSYIQKDWLEKGIEFIRKQFFFKRLEELLSIEGESGNETEIRQVVKEALCHHVDYVTVDQAGNILAQKTYGTGHGPTLLLNAHLDTVERIEPGRTIVKNGSIWSSDKGILGADDRAGVAVMLELARRLQPTSFNGKIKFIFTVEEEIGLMGARSIDETFLWDVDAAIVVDRRGTGDIVTSCGGYEPFCDELYGRFFEDSAKRLGWMGWKTTPGGSSDTRIWASHGIQSVNLSAGYMNEHTSLESLNVEACYNTLNLITAVIHDSRNLQRTLRQIDRVTNGRSEVW